MRFADIKREYRFTKGEIRNYLIAILCLSFIFSFDQWGTVRFDVVQGVTNWIYSMIIATIALFVHDFGHRMVSLRRGEHVFFKLSRNALLWSFLLVILSNGKFKLILAGYLLYTMPEKIRFGRHPAKISPYEHWLTAIAGPIASSLLAILSLLIWQIFGGGFFYNLAVFSGLYALFSMIPIPPFDGFHIFYFSRKIFIGVAGGILVYVLLTFAGWPSVLVSILVGIASAFIWWALLERV